MIDNNNEFDLGFSLLGEELVKPWQYAWRKGFLPQFNGQDLSILLEAVENNSKCLIQGQTTDPFPFTFLSEEKVCGACAISYIGWQSRGMELVGDVEGFFARACHECDMLLGESGGCRYFLNWFDETPTEEAFSELAKEMKNNILTMERENELAT